MNKFLKLTKVLLKNSGSSVKTGYRNKKSIGMLVLLLICFLPLISMITGSLIMSYDIMKKLKLETLLLSSSFTSASAAMMIFGIFYVLSIFYFSEDVDILLPLPIKPYQILGAKLIIVTMFQYILEVIFVLPIFIAFGVKSPSILFFINATILYLTLPIIPTIICALISIVIMSFTKLVKNKDRFKMLSGFVGIIFAILINIFMRKIGGGNSQIADTLKNNQGTMNTVSNILPTSKLAAYSLTGSNPVISEVNLLLFLFISIAFVIIFMIAAQALYFKGAVGISQASAKGKKLTDKQFNEASNRTSVIISYTLKELKLLIRTPAYFLNCILFSVFFPPIILVIMFHGSDKAFSGLPMNNGVFLTAASGIIAVLSSMNMITATAISREGKNFYVMNYIPVTYEKQIISKVLSGIIVSAISAAIFSTLGIILLKIPLITAVLILIIAILGISAYSFLGIILDLKFPKLDWDNETSAVKQNYNPIIMIFGSIIFTVAASIITAVLQLNLIITFVLLFIIYSSLLSVSYKLSLTAGASILGGESYSAYTLRNKKNTSQNKIKIIAIALIVLFILIPTVGITGYESISKTTVTLASNEYKISAGLESKTIDASKITDVYLKDTIPRYSKINGYNGGSIYRGKFSVDGFGDGYLFLEAKNGPYLYIISGKDFVIINNRDAAKTKQLYSKLKTTH